MSQCADLPVQPPAGARRRLAALALALALCLGARAWLIGHTQTIARDGTYYVALAQDFAADPSQAVRGGEVHPGYPACIAAFHSVLGILGVGPGDVRRWELAGQLVSLMAALAATIALWLWAGRTFTWPVACATVVTFSVTKKWSTLGADVLTDALAVSLMGWAAVLTLANLLHGAKGVSPVAAQSPAGPDRRDACRTYLLRRVALAGGVGIFAGLAYLVRPEGLLVLPWAFAAWLIQARRDRSWRPAVLSMLIAAGAAACLCVPYMAAIGGFTAKQQHLHRLLGQASAVSSAEPAADGGNGALLAQVTGPEMDWTLILDKFFEVQHPLLAFLALAYLAAWMYGKRRPLSPLARLLVLPRPGSLTLMACAMALVVPLLFLRQVKLEGMSHRYLLFLAWLTVPLSGAAIVALGSGLAAIVRKTGAAWPGAAVASAVTLGLLAQTLRPLHADRAAYRQAGLYLASHTPPDAKILTDEPWTLHYSGRSGLSQARQAPQGYEPSMDRRAMLAYLIASGPFTHLALSGQTIKDVFPFVPDGWPPSAYRLERKVDPAWTLVAAGNLLDKASVLLWRTDRGRLEMWEVAQQRVPRREEVQADRDVRILGAADLDSRPGTELLAQSGVGGELDVLALDGPRLRRLATLGPMDLTDHEFLGFGRAGGAGRGDLVWRRRSTGVAEAWTLEGLAVRERRNLATIGQVQALAVDLDHREWVDLLLRDRQKADSPVFYWLMGPQGAINSGRLADWVGADMELLAMADLNGDSFADALWRRRSTGQLTIQPFLGACPAVDLVRRETFGRPGSRNAVHVFDIQRFRLGE